MNVFLMETVYQETVGTYVYIQKRDVLTEITLCDKVTERQKGICYSYAAIKV